MIELKHLSKSYIHAEKRIEVLKDLSLEVAAGEQVCLIGDSGAGKSTLLQLLGCLDQADSGVYRVNGRDTAGMNEQELADVRNRQIGFVFQNSHFVDYLTVLENVALPGLYRRAGVASADVGDAHELLERVGLGHRAEHLPSTLSGGERQRAAIARALFNKPALLLADEPTGNLDPENTAQIIRLIQGLRDQQVTVLLVTHDMGVTGFGSRLLSLRDGKLWDADVAA